MILTARDIQIEEAKKNNPNIKGYDKRMFVSWRGLNLK